MGYKLADGSDSEDYVIGDEFLVFGGNSSCSNTKHGDILILTEDDGTHCPYFNQGNNCALWGELKPTPETLRKVAERKGVTQQPLARIVDWRNEEVLETDIVAYKDEDCGEWKVVGPYAVDGYRASDTVIRINFDALPNQRTMTREEVEKDFGVKVAD